MSSVRNPYNRFFSFWLKHIFLKRKFLLSDEEWHGSEKRILEKINSSYPRDHPVHGQDLQAAGYRDALWTKEIFSLWLKKKYNAGILQTHQIRLKEPILSEHGPGYHDLNKVNYNLYKLYYKDYNKIEHFILFENLENDWSMFVNHMACMYNINLSKKLPHRQQRQSENVFTFADSYKYFSNTSIEIFEKYNQDDIEFYFNLVRRRITIDPNLKQKLLRRPHNTTLRGL